MNRTNPIASRVLPMAGRRLPANWQQQAAQDQGDGFDRRDLESMWRTPQWSAKQHEDENIGQAARLIAPSWSELFGSR
jgi:hypothetical protein